MYVQQCYAKKENKQKTVPLEKKGHCTLYGGGMIRGLSLIIVLSSSTLRQRQQASDQHRRLPWNPSRLRGEARFHLDQHHYRRCPIPPHPRHLLLLLPRLSPPRLAHPQPRSAGRGPLRCAVHPPGGRGIGTCAKWHGDKQKQQITAVLQGGSVQPFSWRRWWPP